MKYLLMIYGSHAAWDAQTPEAFEVLMRTHRSIQKELTAAGELLDTNELHLANARVARRDGGTTLVTDGPYAETKDMIAGYYFLDCASIERATEIAARLAEYESGPVEVRQIGTGQDDAAAT